MNVCFLCGNTAIHQFKNGHWCCSVSVNKCPFKTDSDRQSKTGRPSGKKGKPSWNSGKTVEQLFDATRLGIHKKIFSEAIKKSYKNPNRKKLSADEEKARREKIKIAINKRYDNGWMPKAGRCKKISYESPIAGNVLLDGSWELKTAQYFDNNNIEWRRNKNRFSYFFEGKNRFYTPDFYLIKYDLYVEVKGYATKKDYAKWQQLNHKLKIISKQEMKQIKNNQLFDWNRNLWNRTQVAQGEGLLNL